MAQSLPYAVSCKGGLNTNLNQFEILTVAGSATVLENLKLIQMVATEELMVSHLLAVTMLQDLIAQTLS